MDRMLYISMSGAKQTMLAQGVNSNNLANVNTHGFREAYFQQRSMPVFGDGYPTRAYAMTEKPGMNYQSGNIETTGRQLDLAIKGEGWFTVEANQETGEQAYTRAGNLRIAAGGWLVTADGHRVVGNSGPINIPAAEQIQLGEDGSISVLPVGQDPSAMAVIDRIRLVNPPEDKLFKGYDGLVRTDEGVAVEPDPQVKVVGGALESSNVSAVQSLVNMIELSRRFEMQVKMMSTANSIEEKSNQMLRSG